MSDAGPPPRSYEKPRRYEIPERFRPAPRVGDAARRRSGPAAERASAPTEPVARPPDRPPTPAAPLARGPGPGGPQRSGDPAGHGAPAHPGGPGRRPAGGPPARPNAPPPPGSAGAQRRPDTKIVLLAIAVVVVVVGAALGAYLAVSGGSNGPSDAMATRQVADKIYTALNAHDGVALESLRCNPRARSLGTVDGTLSTVHDAAPTSGQTITSADARSTGTLIATDTTDPAARPMRVTFQLHLHKAGSRWCYSGVNATAYAPVGPAPSSATGVPATPSPSASTTDSASVCHDLENQSEALALLITAPVPASAGVMPSSFVPPRSGTPLAYCRALLRPEEARRVAGVAVYAGVRMPQYVALLNSLSWTLVSRSAVAPEYDNKVGVHVTIVQSGPQLVLIARNPDR